MIRIIFITILFLSSNVFAATYLTCKSEDLKDNKKISVKLSGKKLFINENNKGLEDWSEHIILYNKEEIVLQKKFPKREADWTCKEEIAKKEKNIFKKELEFDCDRKKNSLVRKFTTQWVNEEIEKMPNSYIEYRFDRISGLMKKTRKSYWVDWNKISLTKVFINSSSLEKKYLCEVKDKTLF